MKETKGAKVAELRVRDNLVNTLTRKFVDVSHTIRAAMSFWITLQRMLCGFLFHASERFLVYY